MNRPITTLFLLTSLDGKISTGSTNQLDFDQDFPNIEGLKEGLYQYYDIEQTTDLWSLNSGKVQAKIGVNEKELPEKTPVSFVVIDNQNLATHGIEYFRAKSKTFVLITTNPNHPAFSMKKENLHIIFQETLDLPACLTTLKKEYQCERITIQTGGTLNALFLREKLIDYVDVVVAPVLVGGKDTPSLIDGSSFVSIEELSSLGILELQAITHLEGSYVRLQYKVRS